MRRAVVVVVNIMFMRVRWSLDDFMASEGDKSWFVPQFLDMVGDTHKMNKIGQHFSDFRETALRQSQIDRGP
jgi:hypothetical protein